MTRTAFLAPFRTLGGRHTIRAQAALVLTGAAIFTVCTVSAALLENIGFHYYTPGGLPWEKVHPATLLAGAALVARISAAANPRVAAQHMVGADPLLLLYFVAVLVAAVHAVFVSGSPVTGLVDTFVLPALLIIVLRDLDPRLRRAFALLVCGLLAANACVGIIEVLTGWRLVPYDINAAVRDPSAPEPPSDADPSSDIDWRASALLGHPLQNAVVTGALILCLASRGARWLRPGVRFGTLGVCVVAMAAFGGRTSLVLSLVGLVAFAVAAFARCLAAGKPLSRTAVALVLTAMPIVIAASIVVVNAGLLDRLLLRFVEDSGSTNARFAMWDLLDPLSLLDLMVGPDPAVVRVQQHLLGLELGIESFWLALTLTYGLVVAGLLFCGLALLSVRIISASGPGATAVLLFYFLVASTSTSLSSKTTSLALVTLFALLILRDDGKRHHN